MQQTGRTSVAVTHAGIHVGIILQLAEKSVLTAARKNIGSQRGRPGIAHFVIDDGSQVSFAVGRHIKGKQREAQVLLQLREKFMMEGLEDIMFILTRSWTVKASIYCQASRIKFSNSD